MPGEKPYISNGTTSDPREQICWDIYVTNLTKSIDNAYASAIEAGYSESSAKNITMNAWFKERLGKLRRKDMLSKAEKVLDKTLDMITVNSEGNENPALLRIQTDVAKTVVTTLGKDEGYSTRSEVTGKDGKELPTPILINLDGVHNNNSNQESSET